MTISYKGGGMPLTTVAQALHTVAAGTKSAVPVSVHVTNVDKEFRRRLNFWLSITGGRNMIVVNGAEVEFGVTTVFAGPALNPGESLMAYAETLGLLVAASSTGEQR